ncbi:MAG: hypothetical protein CSB48_07790 [Proteobacteria bacterium]|nr:MAG: hypothetical protein CSB48_07790 [Pseudomonadota bacterium]
MVLSYLDFCGYSRDGLAGFVIGLLTDAFFTVRFPAQVPGIGETGFRQYWFLLFVLVLVF